MKYNPIVLKQISLVQFENWGFCCKYSLCDTWGSYSNSSKRAALFQAFEFQVSSLVLWAVSVRFAFCVSELAAKKLKLIIIPKFKYADSWLNPITHACATLRGWKWRETYWVCAHTSFFPLFKTRKNLQISWCLWLLIFSIDLYLLELVHWLLHMFLASKITTISRVNFYFKVAAGITKIDLNDQSNISQIFNYIILGCRWHFTIHTEKIYSVVIQHVSVFFFL